jgi:hypothetical protein
MTRINIVIAAGLALAVTLPTVSAQAQSPRTFVSAAGNDSNPCTFAAPCRHFQAAVNATSAGGEVDALDPAGYGPIIISQAVTIEGQGWSYIAPPAFGTAVTINAVSGNVVIRGVSLNGAGITGSTNGIASTASAALNIQNCVIQNFGGTGLSLAPNGSAQLTVSNSTFLDNSFAVEINPNGSGIVTAIFDRTVISNNTLGGGLDIASGGAAVDVTVSDSVIAHNQHGITTNANAGSINVMVRNSAIVDNITTGLLSQGGSTIRITRSTITGNATAWSVVSGLMQSYGDNNIDGNSSANTAPPCVNGSSPCSAYK